MFKKIYLSIFTPTGMRLWGERIEVSAHHYSHETQCVTFTGLDDVENTVWLGTGWTVAIESVPKN